MLIRYHNLLTRIQITMLELTPEALEAHEWAVSKGISIDSVEEVIQIVLDQEVVTYQSRDGAVCFDRFDVVDTTGLWI